jgi:DNA-binding CsgD family transcriptional regulator
VIGSKIEPWLLSEVSISDGSSIDECISMGMLQSHDRYYSFRHELARQTILESISAHRKIELHHFVLGALKESPETRNDFARLADHAEGAKNVEAILEFAPLAGRRASALGAHRQSYAHYQAAMQYAEQLSPKERAELLDRYADECEATVQMNEAEHAQQEALHLWQELGQREKEGRALRRLSEIVMRQNKDAKMKHYASQAVAVLEKLPPSKELAIAYSHRSRMHMIVYEVEETYHWGNRAMELAEQLGDIETLSHSLTNIGIVEMWHDQHDEGQKKLERSLQLSMEHGYHNHAARAFNNLVDGLIVAHDYATCLTYASEGLKYCNKHDLDNGYIELLSYRIRANYDQGRWAEAENDIHVTREFAATLENRFYVDLYQQKLKVRRGDPLASDDFEKLRQYAHQAIFHAVTYPIAELLAESAWLRGDLIQCRAEVESFFQGACQLNIPIFIGKLGYWMWRAGAITEPPPNAAEPYATQIRGEWRTAASMWESYGCPYEQGMALIDGDESAQLQALEIFEGLGARPIIEKLKKQMHAQGIRVPRGPRPATRENPFGLTAREMEVLASLVEGLNNNAIAKKLSLSTRTVEHHIASILQKLEVSSRNEAVALALKEKLLPFE